MTVHSDYLLVENILFEPSTKLYIPPQFKKKWNHLQQGKVVMAADGLPVATGNIVVYEKHSGFDVDMKGDVLRVLKANHIICGK